MIIRRITPADAAAFIELNAQYVRETDFLLQTEDEIRDITVEKQAELIEFWGDHNHIVWVAEVDGKLVGHLGVRRGFAKATIGTAVIMLAVLEEYQKQGIATALLNTLEGAVDALGLFRISLSVDIDNKKAIALYTKFGFELEGIQKCFALKGDRFMDCYAMAKIYTP